MDCLARNDAEKEEPPSVSLAYPHPKKPEDFATSPQGGGGRIHTGSMSPAAWSRLKAARKSSKRPSAIAARMPAMRDW